MTSHVFHQLAAQLAIQDAALPPGTASLPLLEEAALLLLLGGILLALLLGLRRVAKLESRLSSRMEPLERIEASAQRLAESHGDLELRRLEHALIDIRDGLRRQEDRLGSLLDALEEARQNPPSPALGGDGGAGDPAQALRSRAGGLRDRIVSRLLALGFERIEVLTAVEELETILQSGGEVLLSARRGGAQHKGRAVVRDGSLVDVHMRASYEAFP